MSIKYKKNSDLKTGTFRSDEPGGSSPQLYSAIFNSTPLAIFVVNRNFQIQDANNKFRTLYPRYEGGNGDFCYRIIPEEECDKPCPECLVRKTFVSGAPSSKEEKFIRENSTHYFRKEVSPIFNGNGEITSVVETIEDITHRKNLEIRIGNMSEFQEKILQNDFIGIITTDLSGKITSCNKGAVHILGFPSDEVQQKNISSFIVMENSESYRKFAKRDIKTSAQISRELIFRKKNGEAVNIMYVESTMKDENSKPMAVIAFFFDITEKARLEEKWKELTWRLQQAQLITIVSLAKLAEYRDIETGLHLERIMRYTDLLANELSGYREYKSYISEEYIIDLVNSCPLHDIGKVGIPDLILHKPGRLTAEEFEIIKKHTIIGGDTIAEAEKKIQGRSYLNLGKEIAYYHHERWDGNGYPQGLKGKQIPLSARIVAVADVYDALISKRPYKEPFPHETAMHIITESSGTHFDETVVKALQHCESAFIDLKNSYMQ